MQDKFGHRHRALGIRGDLQELAMRLRSALNEPADEALRAIADDCHPADIADAMHFLNDEEDLALFKRLTPHEQAEILDEVDDSTLGRLVSATPLDELAVILSFLPPDEGADVLSAVHSDRMTDLLAKVELSHSLRSLLTYRPDTAGGLMSLGYVDVAASGTQEQALQRFREKKDGEFIFFVYAVDEKGRLVGTIDLRSLLRAEAGTIVEGLTDKETITVPPEMDQEQVATIFTRYDLTALPVVSGDNVLLGVITADDVIDVVWDETSEDVAQMAGTDATELEKKSPAQVALMRMPWILATMFIELIAGFVIKTFDHTLAQILLLASFMPIISAISGNTGLQSAAIIIRGLSTGHVQMQNWKHSVFRQMETTLILGSVCAVTLGIIGALWYGKWTFGALVALGMFASVNIAGAVGTTIPLISKRMGFDPALTAGPFETAFQDVVGISIFLGMATLLLPYLK